MYVTTNARNYPYVNFVLNFETIEEHEQFLTELDEMLSLYDNDSKGKQQIEDFMRIAIVRCIYSPEDSMAACNFTMDSDEFSNFSLLMFYFASATSDYVSKYNGLCDALAEEKEKLTKIFEEYKTLNAGLTLAKEKVSHLRA